MNLAPLRLVDPSLSPTPAPHAWLQVSPFSPQPIAPGHVLGATPWSPATHSSLSSTTK